MLSHFRRVPLFVPVDCSPLGSSVCGILQARVLEWAVMLSSRGSSWPRAGTHYLLNLLHCRWILGCWATREGPASHTLRQSLITALIRCLCSYPVMAALLLFSLPKGPFSSRPWPVCGMSPFYVSGKPFCSPSVSACLPEYPLLAKGSFSLGWSVSGRYVGGGCKSQIFSHLLNKCTNGRLVYLDQSFGYK